jgi:hypothetical protein
MRHPATHRRRGRNAFRKKITFHSNDPKTPTKNRFARARIFKSDAAFRARVVAATSWPSAAGDRLAADLRRCEPSRIHRFEIRIEMEQFEWASSDPCYVAVFALRNDSLLVDIGVEQFRKTQRRRGPYSGSHFGID